MLSVLNGISFNLYTAVKYKYCFSPFSDVEAKNQSIQVTCPRSHKYNKKQCLSDSKAHILSILPQSMILELSYIEEMYLEGPVTMEHY